MLIKREPMAMPVGTRQTFPIRSNVWIPLQQADPDLSKRHGVHQRPEKRFGSQNTTTCQECGRYTVKMKSLRRDFSSNPQAANVTSKVFVRSTKSGKVQKIVRELYLRQDIPCSSKLCSTCASTAPADANGNSETSRSNFCLI